LFVQDGTAVLFLLWVNISSGIPILVFGESLLYILVHFRLEKFVLELFYICYSYLPADNRLSRS